MRRFNTRRKSTGEKADAYWQEARDLYIRNYSSGKVSRKALRLALTSANRALLLRPQDYDVNLLLGDIYSDLEDANSTAKATEYYDRAVKLRPDLPDAYENKARLLLEQGCPRDALPLARKALRAALASDYDPEYLDLTYSPLIEALIEQGRLSQARATVKASQKKCSSPRMHDTARKFLAWIKDEEKRRSR